MELTLDLARKQQNGFLHGGVLAYAADNAPQGTVVVSEG